MATRSNTRVIRSPRRALLRLEELNTEFHEDAYVKVGLPRGSNAYPDGTDVVMVGAVHEFGSPAQGIEQRSFLRSTVVEKRNDYKRTFKALGKQVTRGRIDMNRAMNILGLQVQTDVRDKFTNNDWKANSDETIEAKGSSSPLLDTGHLRQTITYVVEDE